MGSKVKFEFNYMRIMSIGYSKKPVSIEIEDFSAVSAELARHMGTTRLVLKTKAISPVDFGDVTILASRRSPLDIEMVYDIQTFTEDYELLRLVGADSVRDLLEKARVEVEPHLVDTYKVEDTTTVHRQWYMVTVKVAVRRPVYIYVADLYFERRSTLHVDTGHVSEYTEWKLVPLREAEVLTWDELREKLLDC